MRLVEQKYNLGDRVCVLRESNSHCRREENERASVFWSLLCARAWEERERRREVLTPELKSAFVGPLAGSQASEEKESRTKTEKSPKLPKMS